MVGPNLSAARLVLTAEAVEPRDVDLQTDAAAIDGLP